MIVIAGAGVIGVTSAYYLAKAGHSVTVVDRASAPADGCSFAGAGIVAVGHAESWAGPAAPGQMIAAAMGRNRAVRISRYLDPSLWRWGLKFLRNCTSARHERNTVNMRRLSQYSRENLREIEADLELDFAQGHSGAYYLYTSRGQFRERLTGPTGEGAGFKPFSAEQLVAQDQALSAFTGRLQGGILSSIDSKGDCRAFTRQLANWLTEKHGVKFHFECTVTGMLRKDGRVVALETSGGQIPCDQVVIAAGVATPALVAPLGIRPMIYPVKGYSGSYPILDAAQIPRRPFIDETDLVAVTRLGSDLRVTAIAEFAGYDLSVPRTRAAYLDSYVRQNFPGAVNLTAAQHWAGLRPSTPSGLPYIGRLKSDENVWLNAGHGQLGWTMAAGSGRVLSDLISCQAPQIDQVSEAAEWLVPIPMKSEGN